MTALLSILAVAVLAVVFVLTQRNRGGCPGPEGCEDADGPGRCPGCPR